MATYVRNTHQTTIASVSCQEEKAESKNDSDSMKNSYAESRLSQRLSSQVYNVGTSAVGISINSVKWAASATFSIGAGVVSAAKNVVSKVVPSTETKPKSD